MKRYRVLILFVLCSALLLYVISFIRPQHYYEDRGSIFNTYYLIKYEYDRSLEKEILAELAAFNMSLNPFDKSSVIAKVNNNETVIVDSFFTDVFVKAAEVSRNSGGMFDITAAPLINLWGFGFKNMDNVTPQAVDSLLQIVGYEKIQLRNDSVFKADPRVQLNTSAIAKGYAVDVVCHFFDRLGIQNYMCEIGGEIRARGVNDKGECWRIGIVKPIDDKSGEVKELQTIVKLCDKALATSGNYRNYYMKDGKKYSHTINPLTGYPSEQDILSATVIADDCMTADAYATAFMALGLAEAQKVAASVPGIHYYFICADEQDTFKSICSAGFEQFISD